MSTQLATLGGGCFWCLEAVFEQLRGVTKVVSGYSGGHVPNPSYEAVCTGTTGHAEVVQVTFDPDELSYRDLLGVFFTLHDPTTLDRQGGDVGSQYRSAIFYHDDEQRRGGGLALGETGRHERRWPAPAQRAAQQIAFLGRDVHENPLFALPFFYDDRHTIPVEHTVRRDGGNGFPRRENADEVQRIRAAD